jgi:tetratricopeptide (TPR) repeat protein
MDAKEHMVAAYALDRAGDERGAIRHYDEAWRLGVPADEERRFLVGYGSTLRNVGRKDDAIAILAQAVEKHPGYPALQAFLALALLDAGHPRPALAAMLGVVLDLHNGRLDGYDRALTEYHQELLTPLTPPVPG